jgi:predicted RNA-binding Zn ribbon-like protein
MTQTSHLTLLDAPGATLDAALEFVNTTGLSDGRPFDDLPSVAAALDWLAAHGFLSEEEAEGERARLAAEPSAEAALERLREVRSGLRELIDAVDDERAPAAACLTAVNSVLSLRETTELQPCPDGLRLQRRREGPPLDRALAEISRRVAAEFDEGRQGRLRVCANDRCRWAFYDRSRPGSRRWCEMSSCGNRAKAARHRERQRARAASTTRRDGTSTTASSASS